MEKDSVVTTLLITPQLLLDLIELSTRNHLLALNALGVRWIGKGRK
jgi:hypothetical protein